MGKSILACRATRIRCCSAYSMTIATLARPQAAQQGGGSANLASSLFTLLDKNNDGMVTQDEMRSTFDSWYTQWDTKKTNALTVEQVVFGVFSVFPPPKAGEAPQQNQTPRPEDVAAMIAALPDAAPAKPLRPERFSCSAERRVFRTPRFL